MMFDATGHTLSVCTHLEENNFLKSTPNHKKAFLECSTLKAPVRTRCNPRANKKA